MHVDQQEVLFGLRGRHVCTVSGITAEQIRRFRSFRPFSAFGCPPFRNACIRRHYADNRDVLRT
ncbi:MAG TPA: hypothetical protein VFI52_02905, partial [Gemmatimonadaceae bacterium]|nr:hypothetical protein [Gemmatimonadaceae bacterium]